VLNLFLADEGYRVAEAPDGWRPSPLVDAEAPDLVLSDVMMPRMGGVELVRRLRERGLGVPVILLSACATVVACRTSRCSARPFDIEAVVRQVGCTLAGG
jgi:two-component system response regulator AtoC